jgi:hypothetical protein
MPLHETSSVLGFSKQNGSKTMLADSDSDSEDGGAALDSGFKVNEEYARRFEHNKKREERHRRKNLEKLNVLNELTILHSGGKIQACCRRRRRIFNFR